MTFVDLAAGARTYIAALKLNTDFAAANAATNRVERKTFAYNTMIDAERAVTSTLAPKLDALRAQGLVQDWEVASGTGALIVNVDEKRAAAAYDALRGVSELGRIIRNREIKLDAPVASEILKSVNAPKTKGEPIVEWNVEKMGAQKAWAKGVRGEGVVVGIIDTGANIEHEALRRQYRGTQADGSLNHDYAFFDPINGRTEAYDDNSHGSHVAGTSVGGTSDRFIGMAPDAKFIAAKVFTAGGSGNTAAILKGLSWMLAPTKADGTGADPSMAPDIVSNSWGNSDGSSLTYLDAFRAFHAAGIVPVVSAGNSGPRGNTIGSPGSYGESITVGATDQNDKAAVFSSRGPSKIKDNYGEFFRKPDVSAPGVNIISAGKSGNQYVRMSGTSMAAPAVSGVVALLLSKYPQLTIEQVRDVLTTSAVDVDAPGWDINTGHGRVDIEAALNAAEKMVSA